LEFTRGLPVSSTSVSDKESDFYNLAVRAVRYLTGTADSFDASKDDLPDIGRLEFSRPFLKQQLALLDTPSDRRTARASIYDYLSNFSGTIQVTYTYIPVPEPASAAIFAAGILTLSAMRRRKTMTRQVN